VFRRITVTPGILDGKPCIRGMRFSVAQILRMLAEGMTSKEILDEHPDLEDEDITESLLYAAQLSEEQR